MRMKKKNPIKTIFKQVPQQHGLNVCGDARRVNYDSTQFMGRTHGVSMTIVTR